MATWLNPSPRPTSKTPDGPARLKSRRWPGLNQPSTKATLKKRSTFVMSDSQAEPRYAQLLRHKTRAWLCTQLQRWDEARQMFTNRSLSNTRPLWARFAWPGNSFNRSSWIRPRHNLDALLAQDPNCMKACDELARVRTLQGTLPVHANCWKSHSTVPAHNLLRQKRWQMPVC